MAPNKRTLPSGNQRGTTLVELIVVTTVLTIVAGVVGQILVAGMDSFQHFQTRKEALQCTRIALQRMLVELRQTKDEDGMLAADDTEIEFIDVNDNTITFTLSGDQVLRNSDTLVDNVNDLQIQYYDNDGTELSPPVEETSDVWRIKITLTLAAGDGTVSLSSQVMPRALSL